MTRSISSALVLSFACVACGGGGATGGPVPQASSPGATATYGPGTSASAAPQQTPTPTSTSSAPASSVASIPFPATPDSDPFYAQPSTFPSLVPGTILASRAVTFAPIQGVAMQNAAWQIKFVSRDTFMHPIAAVATVVKPLVPAVGTEPLLSQQFAEDGLGSICAPSHAVTGNTTDSNEQLEAVVPLQGLEEGWTVVYPDYEGPQSAFFDNRLEGQIVLDAIRAAEQFAPLGLTANTPVAMSGYSGGAIATSWAASLESAYAPELNVVAIASGGTPAVLELLAQSVDTNIVDNETNLGLIFSVYEGLNRTYPALLTPILNAKGVAAMTSLQNGCVGNTSNGAPKPTGQLTDYVTTNFFTPPNDTILPIDDLPLAGHAPVKNMFVYHTVLDEIVPIAGADTMVQGWCAAGSTIQYYRGQSGEHIAFEGTMAPIVYAYLAARFQGTTVLPPTTTTCN